MSLEVPTIPRLGELEERGPLKLLVVSESTVESVVLPAAGAVVMGRARDCDVPIGDESVSRKHARLHLAPLRVEDMGSSNGTRVGAHRVGPGELVSLSPGDAFVLGSVTVFVQRMKVAAPEAAPAEDPETRAPASAEGARAPASGARAVEIVAVDPATVAVRDRVGRLASSELPVLFLGEEGSGKRTFAASLHARSRLAHRPLVRVSCVAISDAVLEADLFGVEAEGRPGALEAADGGVLLLEQVDALPAAVERQLAHALEYGQTCRVGSTTPRHTRVRVVATARGRTTAFVERVLVGRLASVVVEVPPLRARRADIEPLARQVLGGGRELSPEAIVELAAHPWPGNVRELRATVDRTMHATSAIFLEAGDLDLPPLPATPPPRLRSEVERLERERIEAALAAHGGNRSRAARALGIARNTLLTRLRSYGQ